MAGIIKASIPDKLAEYIKILVYNLFFGGKTINPKSTMVESTSIKSLPTGKWVYLLIIMATISVPPEVAFALKIKPKPKPIITAPKILANRTSLAKPKISPVPKIEVNKSTKIAVETVQNYLFYFCQAFMLHKVNRYDLKGKKILEYSEKYYPADIGLRFGVTGYSDADISGVLETIVYLELLNRGYKVFVGQTGVQEIDFIAEKQDEKLYIQVAYLLNQESTIEREFGNLMAVKDNFPKIIKNQIWYLFIVEEMINQ